MSGWRSLVQGLLGRAGYRLARIDAPAVDPVAHNAPDSVDAFYADPGWVREYASPERLAFFEKVVEVTLAHGVSLDARDVCDVGCGTGHLLAAIARRARPAALSGYEHSEPALAVARQTCPQARLATIDLMTSVAPSTHDVVFCTEVLEHLIAPEVALATLAAMVAPGGALVLTVPDGRRDTFAGHLNFWSHESWRHFLERDGAGLSVATAAFGDAGAHLLGVLRPGAAG